MFTYYIAKATANFGLPATRPIYERAIESLPDKQTAEMCLRFAALERKLGEIDRARAIFAHASQFCDPRVSFLFSFTRMMINSLFSSRIQISGLPGILSRLKLVQKILLENIYELKELYNLLLIRNHLILLLKRLL